MARRHAPGRFVRPAPKTSIWIGAGIALTTLVANQVQVLGTLNAAALALRPFTILRTRLNVSYESDQEAASERSTTGFGIIVANDTATALGPTALPDPDSIAGDPDADWFVWQGMHYSFRLLGAADADLAPFAVQYEIDSKAMRKVGPNEDIAFMTSINAFGAFIVLQGRMLVQLH